MDIAPDGITGLCETVAAAVKILDEQLERPVESAPHGLWPVQQRLSVLLGKGRHSASSGFVLAHCGQAKAREVQEVFPRGDVRGGQGHVAPLRA